MSEPSKYPYGTYLDIKFPALSLVDVPSLVEAVTDRWYNQTLCKINDSVVRLGVMQGEYHWHTHDNDDEFFFVLEGTSSSTWKTGRSTSSRRKGSSFPRASSTARAPRTAR